MNNSGFSKILWRQFFALVSANIISSTSLGLCLSLAILFENIKLAIRQFEAELNIYFL